MKRLPIRWTIALLAASTTGGALVAFLAAVLFSLNQEQIETADLAMRTEANHLLEAPPGEIAYGSWFQQVTMDQPLLACFIDPANDRFVNARPQSPSSFALRASGHNTPKNLRLADGNWRVCSYRIKGRDVLIAYDLYDVSDRISDLITACVLAFPFGIIVASLGAWIVAGRALAPVRVVTETAAIIEAGALDLRLPPQAFDDEVGRLTTVFNQMLERLGKSFLQSNRFAADASHELRTPLTIMKGELDVILLRKDLTPELEAQLLSLQEEISRLNRITEHLLLLARFDAGQTSEIEKIVDLSALTNEACEDAEIFAATKQVHLETLISPGIRINGDPGQLRRVLLNLLDNACKYNAPDGHVRCTLEISGGRVRLAVANTGPGIPPELRPRLFDRFFRADAARGNSGHGLGLSLCREIIHAHKGDVFLSETPVNGTTEFVVILPLAPA